MPSQQTTLRAAMAQAARVLADEQHDLAERVGQARALLITALEATATFSPAQRQALEADPGVQAALARLAAGDEAYLLVRQDDGLSDEPLEPRADERPVGSEELTRLGR